MLKEIVKDSVAILSPCANSVEPLAYQFAMTLVSGAWAKGHKVSQIGVTERMVIQNARELLAKEFLNTDCEWAFWLDSDMVLPSNTIPTLIKRAKEVNGKMMTGVYYQRLGNHNPLILIRDERIRKYEDEFSHSNICPPENCKTPFKVHVAGFGCMLVHRDVFNAMEEPYFKWGYINDKKDFSEDFYFCLKARKAGFDLWAVPELECLHIGRAALIGRKDFKGEANTMKFEVETFKGESK